MYAFTTEEKFVSAQNYMKSSNSRTTHWLADSCCGIHMTWDSNDFIPGTLEVFNGGSAKIGSGDLCPATHRGKLKPLYGREFGTGKLYPLPDFGYSWLIPSIAYKILSTGRLEDYGVQMTTGSPDSSCPSYLLIHEDNIKYKLKKQNHIYVFPTVLVHAAKAAAIQDRKNKSSTSKRSGIPINRFTEQNLIGDVTKQNFIGDSKNRFQLTNQNLIGSTKTVTASKKSAIHPRNHISMDLWFVFGNSTPPPAVPVYVSVADHRLRQPARVWNSGGVKFTHNWRRIGDYLPPASPTAISAFVHAAAHSRSIILENSAPRLFSIREINDAITLCATYSSVPRSVYTSASTRPSSILNLVSAVPDSKTALMAAHLFSPAYAQEKVLLCQQCCLDPLCENVSCVSTICAVNRGDFQVPTESLVQFG